MLYLFILPKRYAHGMFAAGRALVPTQEKKNRDIIRKLGNVKKSQNFIELWLSVQSSSRPPKMKILSILAKNF